MKTISRTRKAHRSEAHERGKRYRSEKVLTPSSTQVQKTHYNDVRADFKRKQTRRFQTNNITLIIANPVSIRFSFFPLFRSSFCLPHTFVSSISVCFWAIHLLNLMDAWQWIKLSFDTVLIFFFSFFFFGRPSEVILLCIRNEDVMQCLDSRAGRVLLVVFPLSLLFYMHATTFATTSPFLINKFVSCDPWQINHTQPPLQPLRTHTATAYSIVYLHFPSLRSMRSLYTFHYVHDWLSNEFNQ